jgi:hypothetical protein
MYRVQVINYIDKFLKEEGFTLKEEGDKTAQLLFYSKELNFITIGIRFLAEIYENNQFYGFVNCNQISLVENIVAYILHKNEITAVKPIEVHNTIMTRDYDDYRLLTKGILIDSEEKAKEVCTLFDKFYIQYFFPFYQKWNSLYTLYEFIKDKEGREELHDILGQFWQFKKAAILRLCNDKNYQEYMNTIYKREKKYFDEDPNDIDNIRYYNAAKELKEVLDKTEPVYNI